MSYPVAYRTGSTVKNPAKAFKLPGRIPGFERQVQHLTELPALRPADVFRRIPPEIPPFGRSMGLPAQPIRPTFKLPIPWRAAARALPWFGYALAIGELYPVLARKGWDIDFVHPAFRRIAGPFTYGYPYNGPPTKWEGFTWTPWPITDAAVTVPDNLPTIPEDFTGIFGVWTGRVWDFARFAETSAWEVSAHVGAVTGTIIEVVPSMELELQPQLQPVPFWAIPSRVRTRWEAGNSLDVHPALKPLIGLRLDMRTGEAYPAPELIQPGEPFLRQVVTVDPRLPGGGSITTEIGTGPREPPGRNEKERKARDGGAIGKGLAVFGQATEVSDAVDAIYKALPKKVRGREWYKSRKQDPSMLNKIKAIFSNYDQVDIQKALEEIGKDQLQDALIGKASNKANSDLARMFKKAGLDPNTMGRLGSLGRTWGVGSKVLGGK